MAKKQRFYDFAIENADVKTCDEFRKYIKSYENQIRKIEERSPCGFILTMQFYSCGNGSINKFYKITRLKYKEITITPPTRLRKNVPL